MLDNILNFFQSISLYDYLIIGFLIIFAIIGFTRGGAKIIIHSLWFIICFLLATIFYEDFRSLNIFDFIINNQQIILLVNFLSLLIIFYLIKISVYKALNAIANMHGPCPFNRFLAFFIGYGLIVILSWYFAIDVHNIKILTELLTNDILRFALSFVFIIFALLTISYIFIVLLNIKVGIDRPCPLIKALQPLDDILNAKNINNFYNSFAGVFLGVVQGFVLLIIIFIIINHTNFATNDILVNANGILQSFHNIAINVQNVLSKYLLFIKN